MLGCCGPEVLAQHLHAGRSRGRGRPARRRASPRARSGPSARGRSRPSSSAASEAARAAVGAVVVEQVGRQGGDDDLAALLLQQDRRAQPDGSQAEHDRPLALEVVATWRSARSSWPRSCCSRWSRASTETLNGPKNAFCTSAKISSPAATCLPPTQMAVFFRSSGPRVKNASCARARASSRVTLPCESRTSTSGVVRDDRVERAGVLLGVELEQDFLHDASSVSSSGDGLVERAVSRTRSRRGSSKVR